MISVIIPVFNCERFIIDTIHSVLKQTISDFEIIIVDDFSTDRSASLITDLLKSDPRILFYLNESKKGAAGARNTGIRHAKGEWITFLDADDVYLPNALESRISVLDKYPDAEFISADVAYIYSNGAIEEKGFFQTRKGEMVIPFFARAYESNEIVKIPKPVQIFLNTVMVNTDTVFIKRSIFGSVGVFEESLERSEDDHLWIRIARVSDLYFVPTIVALYRQHDSSITKRDEPPGDWGLKAFTLLLKDSDFFPYTQLIKQRIARFYAENSYYYREKKQFLNAFNSAVAWLRFDILNKQAYRCLLATCIGK